MAPPPLPLISTIHLFSSLRKSRAKEHISDSAEGRRLFCHREKRKEKRERKEKEPVVAINCIGLRSKREDMTAAAPLMNSSLVLGSRWL